MCAENTHEGEKERMARTARHPEIAVRSHTLSLWWWAVRQESWSPMGPLLKGLSHSARSSRFALKSVRLRGVGATAHTSRAEDPAGMHVLSPFLLRQLKNPAPWSIRSFRRKLVQSLQQESISFWSRKGKRWGELARCKQFSTKKPAHPDF